jgi:hypothetical protein
LLTWLKSLFGNPTPSGPPETIRVFSTSDATLSRDGITALADGWLVDAKDQQTIRLFELQNPQIEQCLIAYRAKMKGEGLTGRAFLEMWCRLPGSGEFYSKGVNQPLKGSTDWASYEIPFHLKKGQRPDLIKLNLAVEGTGKIWMKDLELLKTPLACDR